MHRPLIYFNYEKVNSSILLVWYKGSKTFKGSLLYINKHKETELYNAILSIANNNSDSNRLMYFRVIKDAVEGLRNDDYDLTAQIEILKLLNDFNYRIKLRDRT